MTIAYFDCFSGAAGDMIVGALIDAGADGEELKRRLAGLGVGGYTITIEKVVKQGLAATRFHVELEPGGKQPHRHLKNVLAIIDAAQLSPAAKEKASAIFTRLAKAEAEVHGTTIEKVHFHEVGAVDAIIDVVGAVLAMEMLEVTRVECSPIAVGSGTIKCSHGVMPVPAPATALMLRGVPIEAGANDGELTTPTAAAILRTLAESFGPMPSMTTYWVGHGAGARDGKYGPNVLRLMVGFSSDPERRKTETAEPGTEEDLIFVLETNLDDATPQVIGHCMERLLEAGALDVFTVPIQMKKNRPGVMLCVLGEAGTLGDLESIIFAETPTLGIRSTFMQRTKLRRRYETMETPFGSIRMKIGERQGGATAMPEYEDCRAAAVARKVALRDVITAAQNGVVVQEPTLNRAATVKKRFLPIGAGAEPLLYGRGSDRLSNGSQVRAHMDVTQLDTFVAAPPFLKLNLAHWILLAAAVGIITVLMMLARRTGSRSRLTRRSFSRRERPRPIRSDDAARDIEEVMTELDALAHEIHARLDARLAKLEAMIHDADERIEQLIRLTRQRDDLPAIDVTVGGAEAEEPATKADTAETPVEGATVPAGHAAVYTHADAGLSCVEIAEKVGRTTGEVELVLALRKAKQQIEQATAAL